MTRPGRWACLGLLSCVSACHVPSSGRPRACSLPGCEPQQCGSDDNGCDGIVLEGVWIWDGHACVPAYASGCGTVGTDCESLFATADACRSAYAHCSSCKRK